MYVPSSVIISLILLSDGISEGVLRQQQRKLPTSIRIGGSLFSMKYYVSIQKKCVNTFQRTKILNYFLILIQKVEKQMCSNIETTFQKVGSQHHKNPRINLLCNAFVPTLFAHFIYLFPLGSRSLIKQHCFYSIHYVLSQCCT